jgi:glyoxylase-like metal-dependent hydrolase (beta-lactamase superfamily II)
MTTTSASDVSVREFGEMTVAVVHAGRSHWFPPGFAGRQDWHQGVEIDSEGRAILGINGMIAKLPNCVAVIDPNALSAQDLPPTVQLDVGSPIQVGLDALGVSADEVKYVLITHGHFDHFTGLLEPRDSHQLRFPNAQHYFPAADIPADGDSGRHVDEVRRSMSLVQAAGKLTLVQSDTEVIPGIDILLAPGETPGHQVVRLGSGNHAVYYLGDLVHLPVEVVHPSRLSVVDRDPAMMVESRLRVFADQAGHDATFVFTHGVFPAWGRIAPDGPADWSWTYCGG